MHLWKRAREIVALCDTECFPNRYVQDSVLDNLRWGQNYCTAVIDEL